MENEIASFYIAKHQGTINGALSGLIPIEWLCVPDVYVNALQMYWVCVIFLFSSLLQYIVAHLFILFLEINLT